MKTYKIKTTFIDYAIEEEDLDYCETEEEFEREKEKILLDLPQTLTFSIYCNEEDLEDEVVDYVSERTGWLLYGLKYKII